MFSPFQPLISHTGNGGKKDRDAQAAKQREPTKGGVPSLESSVREGVFGWASPGAHLESMSFEKGDGAKHPVQCSVIVGQRALPSVSKLGDARVDILRKPLASSAKEGLERRAMERPQIIFVA